MNATIQHFGLAEKEVILKDNEFYLPVSKLAEVLEIPKNNLLKNIQMNKEEFGEIGMEYYSTPSGTQKTYILNEEQIYTLCMISRSPKAKEFRKAFAKMIKAIRTREFVHVSVYNKALKELNEARAKNLAAIRRIPERKLSRYKKYRALGLSRKELCKALDLPYQTMREIDKILGFYKPNPNAINSMRKTLLIKNGNLNLFEANYEA